MNQNTQNDTIVGTIYSTVDYDKFIQISNNREINTSHLKKLVKSIEEVGTNFQAIIVNSSMEVLDGNHRLSACIVADKPVRYEIMTPQQFTNDKIMIQLNINSKNWSLENYAKHFSFTNATYKRLCDVAINNKIGFQAACDIVGINTKNIRNGLPIELPSDFEQRVVALNEVRNIYKIKTTKALRSQAAAKGIWEVLERKARAMSQGNTLADDFTIDKALKHLQKVIPTDGMAENPEVIARILSKSYDYGKAKNKLFLAH